jgi:hypothetical protein
MLHIRSQIKEEEEEELWEDAATLCTITIRYTKTLNRQVMQLYSCLPSSTVPHVTNERHKYVCQI